MQHETFLARTTGAKTALLVLGWALPVFDLDQRLSFFVAISLPTNSLI
jgi:hypothetical protein